MNYKQKYLKYKLKYLNLKKILGGMDPGEEFLDDFFTRILEPYIFPHKEKLLKTKTKYTLNTWITYLVNKPIDIYNIIKEQLQLNKLFIPEIPEDFFEKPDEYSILWFKNDLDKMYLIFFKNLKENVIYYPPYLFEKNFNNIYMILSINYTDLNIKVVDKEIQQNLTKKLIMLFFNYYLQRKDYLRNTENFIEGDIYGDWTNIEDNQENNKEKYGVDAHQREHILKGYNEGKKQFQSLVLNLPSKNLINLIKHNDLKEDNIPLRIPLD
tara:strand:+ start:95 stop:898 length:804 start_codon:yes stop_codon:yes gene_type:complete